MLTDFDKLPERLQTDAVRGYYELLDKKRRALAGKRVFDVAVSLLLIVLLSPLLLLIALCVKLDSRGPVFYRQERVTRDMKMFRIYKFRSMVTNADVKGPLVTVSGDSRVTTVGGFLRRVRLDELPQLFNILAGDMTFVGTRPEVPRYVGRYTDEMCATLLLPAGITSPASIAFRDEERLIAAAADADEIYIGEILPQKMAYNLRYLKEFSFLGDVRVMLATLGIYRKRATGIPAAEKSGKRKEK